MKNFTYNLQTYGCQMNISDAQRVSGILKNIGGEKIDDENSADIVIMVTCSVRQKGEERVKGKIRDIRRNNPQSKIGLTGCMIHHSKEKLLKKLSNLDFVFRINDLRELPKILNLDNCDYTDNKKDSNTVADNYFSIAPDINSSVRAYIPIMSGCDNFCSYCIVPYARGREWSQDIDKILTEAEKLISEGYPEIFLLGQNVNSYKCPKTGADFPELLRKLDNISSSDKKDKWQLRFVSPHPKDLSDDLVECFAELKHLTPWMHLPIQSGSDRIIQAMNRHYTVEEYAVLFEKLRKARPDIVISTDIIVGFPGETREDFEKTIDVWRRFEFDFSFISQYSVRPGTAASKMKDDVIPEEKKRRWGELNELQREISIRKLAELLGQEVEILVENISKNRVEGRTVYMQNVKLKCPDDHGIKSGDFVRGKITNTRDWSVEGDVLFSKSFSGTGLG